MMPASALGSAPPRIALVTGANSGIGFEASAQLAEEGFHQVILGCRSLEKAHIAVATLQTRTGLNVFLPLEIDLGDLNSVRAAANSLSGAGISLNALILNAGVLPDSSVVRTADGIERTSAASLVGHHVLTLALLRHQAISSDARIIIAGSEGARGDAPGMKPVALDVFAKRHFSGDLDSAIHSLITMQPPAHHHWSTTYCTAKVFVALWAHAMAPRLPDGMAVSAVSPGNVPATRAGRHQPWLFRLLLRVVSLIGPALGLATPISVGARRYLDALRSKNEDSGHFFASPPGKLVGRLTRQKVSHLCDPHAAAACLRVLQTLTGERELPVDQTAA